MTTSSSNDGKDSNKVNVIVRVRPLNQREQSLRSPMCTFGSAMDAQCGQASEASEGKKSDTIFMDAKPDPRPFTFDRILWERDTQDQVFRTVGRPAAEALVEGYNGAVFVYGQTGSGKTFTMHGADQTEGHHHDNDLHNNSNGNGDGDADGRGLIPRTLEYIFSLAERQKRLEGDSAEYLVKVSFLEIYNEQVHDLLDDASPTLNLREDMKRGVYAEGLREEPVNCPTEALELLRVGTRNRKVGETSMNRESSRSHSVFTVCVETKHAGEGGVVKIRRGHLHLVDLAGSERQKATKAAGSRLKEASSINKSLSALGNVIMALADISAGKTRHVPFRDSRLTFLLKDSLGGNAKTTVIANVSPASVNFGETLSTLQFAQRAKSIKTSAVVNEDTSGSVNALQKEIRKLREELMVARATGSAAQGVAGVGLGDGGIGDEFSSAGAFTGGPDGQQIQQILQRLRAAEGLLAKCGVDAKEAEAKAKAATERADAAEALATKRENANRSTTMKVKFREAEIARLHKSIKGGGGLDAGYAAARIKDLEAEVENYKKQWASHPEVAKLAVENHKLADQLRAAKALAEPAASEEISRLKSANAELLDQVSMLVKDKHSLIDSAAAAGGIDGAGTLLNGSHCDGANDSVLNVSVSHIDGHNNSSILMSPVRGAALEQFEKERWTLRDAHAKEVRELRADLDRVREELAGSSAECEKLRETNSELSENNAELTSALKSSKMVSNIRLRKLTEQLTVFRKAARASAAASVLPEDEENENNNDDNDGGNVSAHDDVVANAETASKTVEDLARMEIVVAEIQDKLASSEETANTLREELAKSKSSVDDAEARVSVLETRCTESTAEISDLKEKLATTESELEKVRDRASELLDAADDADALRVAAEARESTATRDLEKLTNEMGTLSGHLEVAEAEAARAGHELVAAKEECSSLKAQLDTAKAELEAKLKDSDGVLADLEARSEAERAAKTKMEEMEADMVTVTSRLATAESTNRSLNEALESVRKELISTREQLAGATAGKDDLESRVASAEEEVASRDAEIDSLRAEIAQVEVVIEELRDAKSEHFAQRESAVSVKESALDDREVALRKREGDAKARECAAKARQNAMVAEMGTREAELKELEAGLEARDAELASREAQIAAKEEALGVIQARFEEMESDITEQRKKAEEGVASGNAGRAVAAAANEKLRELEREKSEWRAMSKAREEELRTEWEKEWAAKTGTSLSSAETNLAEITIALKESEVKIENLEAENGSLRSREAELTAAVESAEAAREAKNARIASLNDEVRNLKGQSDALLANGRRQAEALATAEGSLAEWKTKLDRLEKERTALRASHKCEVRERAQAMARCVTLEAQLENRRDEMEHWLGDMNRLKAEEERAFRELQAEREESDMLKGIVAKLQRECAALNKRVESATIENAKLVGQNNPNQRIHHHQQVKIENKNLQDKVRELSEEIARKERLCGRLAKMVEVRGVSEEGKENGKMSTLNIGGTSMKLPFDVEAEDALRERLDDTIAATGNMSTKLMSEIGRVFTVLGEDNPASNGKAHNDVHDSESTVITDLGNQVDLLHRLAGIVEEKIKESAELERALKDAEFKIAMHDRAQSIVTN